MRNNSICRYCEVNGICEVYVKGYCSFKECELFQGRKKFLKDAFKEILKGNRYNPNASKPIDNFEPENDVFNALENVLNCPESSLSDEKALDYIMKSYKKYKDKNQTKPKIIFLDVDGVLNSICDSFDRKLKSDYHLRLLAEIIRKTNAKIVVSSAWRLIPNPRYFLEKRLKEFGIEIYDWTIQIFNQNRWTEIKYWLENHEYDTFVVLDNSNYMGSYDAANHLVQTSYETGLLKADAEKAIKILNKEV